MNKIITLILILALNTLTAVASLEKDLIDAAYRNDIDTVKLLLENGADPNAEDSQALIKAGLNGHTEIVKLLLEKGASAAKALENDADTNSDILTLLIDHCTKPSVFLKPQIIKSIIKKTDLDRFRSIYNSQIMLSNPSVIREVLLSGEYNFVKYLFDNVPELKDAYLIGVGLSDTRGATTANVLSIVSDKIEFHKNGYHVEISLEIAQDESIMQHFSGFINPGAGDSYPNHGEPFVLADMEEEKKMYHEKVYQQVITMAKKYDIPYLGLCAGSQHLVLNSQGSLKRGFHMGMTTVTFTTGTIPHFLLLTEEEKSEALSQCKLENIQLFDARAMHGYAGDIKNLGEGIKLAAISETGIPESYSLGANKIGSQFHPEMNYYATNYLGLINRHKQFLDNIFGIFEGYYRSMEYARKMGISRDVAKAAIQKVNQELIERLEYCSGKIAHKTIEKTCAFDPMENNKTRGTSIQKDIHLWDKGLNIEYSENVETISVMPGLSASDVAITRESGNDLAIYAKDGEGHLTILDRFDASKLKHPLRLAFADGSSIDLDPADDYGAEVSFPGDELVKLVQL